MKKGQTNNGFWIFLGLIILSVVCLIGFLSIKNTYVLNEPPTFIDIGLGNVSGVSSIYKFGYNNNVGTSEEVIWDAGGEYIFLTSAETMNVVSSDIDDTNGGDGAWNITIFGLDENHNEISEEILLQGTTPVTTTNSFIRVFRAYIGGVGISRTVEDANQGTITITSSTTATLQAQINPKQGQTQMVVYTIPANNTGCFYNADANVGKGKDAIVRLKSRQCEGINCPFNTKAIRQLYENSFIRNYQVPRCVPEKTDIVMTAISSASGTTVSASFEIVLIENGEF